MIKLTRNTLKSNNKLCSVLDGGSGGSFHISIPSGSEIGRHLLIFEWGVFCMSLHSVDPLIEHPNPVPFISVSCLHTSPTNLIKFEDIGVLIPRSEVTSFFKICDS